MTRSRVIRSRAAAPWEIAPWEIAPWEVGGARGVYAHALPGESETGGGMCGGKRTRQGRPRSRRGTAASALGSVVGG